MLVLCLGVSGAVGKWDPWCTVVGHPSLGTRTFEYLDMSDEALLWCFKLAGGALGLSFFTSSLAVTSMMAALTAESPGFLF